MFRRHGVSGDVCCWQAAGGEGPVSATVSIDSLGGRSMRLFLRKRPGFENEDVLGSGGEGDTGLR